jgi:hypothetical protein
MQESVDRFLQDQSGAITVDWVVMSAAVVGLGISGVTAVRVGTSALGTDISSGLSAASVVTLNDLSGAFATALTGLYFTAQEMQDLVDTYTEADQDKVLQNFLNTFQAAYDAMEDGDLVSAGMYLDYTAAALHALESSPKGAPEGQAEKLQYYIAKYKEMSA